ncbi:hypothetical protein QAD02_007053 [Eretmocerus hayati]|uniref:Uncharacterized protein n=1 Tax=Eretmocerus hayati TaxID=131215 RepID=A0ACC2N2Y8_9HYME|nr:hypothetical protein QAD02_007053 [Eretmocerus hayati]
MTLKSRGRIPWSSGRPNPFRTWKSRIDRMGSKETGSIMVPIQPTSGSKARWKQPTHASRKQVTGYEKIEIHIWKSTTQVMLQVRKPSGASSQDQNLLINNTFPYHFPILAKFDRNDRRLNGF